MAKVNRNDLARAVTLAETGKRSADRQTIAQVKEVQRLTFEALLRAHSFSEILAMLEDVELEMERRRTR